MNSPASHYLTKICTACHKELPYTEFASKASKERSEHAKRRPDRYRDHRCKQCRQANINLRYQEAPRKRQPLIEDATQTKTCSLCGIAKPRTLEHWRRHYFGPNGLAYRCRDCHRTKERAPEVRVKVKRYQKREHIKQRLAVLQHYGGPDPACVCCGEKTFEFLALDHIEKNGHLHRKKFRGPIAYWLLKNNFPPEYKLQVMCHNCNNAKAYYERCPHQA